MKSPPSSTDFRVRWWQFLSIAAALFALGFTIGANVLVPGFLSVKFHELVASIGTAGALIVMAWSSRREKTWRRADRLAQGRVVWGIIAMETVRLWSSFKAVEDELNNWIKPDVLNWDTFRDEVSTHIREADLFIKTLFLHAERLHLLPPDMASNLGAVLGQYGHWKDTVNLAITPNEHIDPRGDFGKIAFELTGSLSANLKACIEAARRPESEMLI